MRKSGSKSRMLLLELLLSVFIFSFCVIICAGVFFQGYSVQRDSRDLTRAVQAAQSAAEAFKATGSLEELAWVLEGKVVDGSVYFSYDKDGRIVPEAVADGAGVTVTVTAEGNLSVANISVVTHEYGNTHYTLTVSKLAGEVH